MRDASGEAGTDGVDWIAGARDEHDIARIDECKRNMPDALLRADQREDFVRRVQGDMKAACVPVGHCFAERQHTLIRWILVVLRVFGGFAEAFDDRHRRRQVGVADAKVNDINAFGNRGLLHLIDGGEQIGRQCLDSGGNLDGKTRHANRLLS